MGTAWQRHITQKPMQVKLATNFTNAALDLACWFYRQFHEFVQRASYKLGIVSVRLQTLRANSLAEGGRNSPVFVSIGHEMI